MIGIDEVGRGPIAGPVTLAGVRIINARLAYQIMPTVRDSKSLSEKQRCTIYCTLLGAKKDGAVEFVTSSVSAGIIDQIGIATAVRRAVAHVLRKLAVTETERVFLDGSLKAPAQYRQKTIIKGDTKERAIALASIVAKVRRDGYMKRLALKYPGYGFEKHAGYGTRQHYQALDMLGLSKIHRKSFIHGKLD